MFNDLMYTASTFKQFSEICLSQLQSQRLIVSARTILSTIRSLWSTLHFLQAVQLLLGLMLFIHCMTFPLLTYSKIPDWRQPSPQQLPCDKESFREMDTGLCFVLVSLKCLIDFALT